MRDLVPGGAWLDAWGNRQRFQPLVGFTSKGLLVPQADGRKLSRAKVKSGLGDYAFAGATVGTRRLTPPQAVDLEDAIDGRTLASGKAALANYLATVDVDVEELNKWLAAIGGVLLIVLTCITIALGVRALRKDRK